MTPDITLEHTVEQLISALNKKLLMECARVRPQILQISRALVATLTAEVDTLEKHAKNVLHEVARLRNLLRPVNRLPPEVLTSCATFVSNADPRPIVSLTHVCRYWRKAITSNPRNWTSIATGWKSLVPLCLERAGAVPLTVDISVPDIKNSENFASSLLPHTSRIRRLRLAGLSSVEAVADDLRGLFDSPMSNLASLELQQTLEPGGLFPSAGTPVPPVFQNVSKLESVHLTRTPLYPTLFSIPSLRELKLLGYTNPFDFGTLMNFLRSNLRLENLVLDLQFTANSVEGAPSGTKVSLSRLRDLSIICSRATDSRGLLSCISLPRGVHTEITSTLSDTSAELCSFLPSPLTPVIELLNPITTVKNQMTPRHLQVIGNSAKFTFRSPKGTTRDAHVGFIMFPTTAVRELYTNVYPNQYNDAAISDLVLALPTLEVLAVTKTSFPAGLLPVLITEPVLWPTLKTVAFLDCNITADIVKKLGEAIAKRRYITGAQVFRVVIISSTGTPLSVTSIQELRKSVPCVEIRVDDKFPDLT